MISSNPEENGQIQTLHAGCIRYGKAGILICGPAGSGKSSLIRMLLDDARQNGISAAFISDDRTVISLQNHRITARSHPAIAGKMEIRGFGIVDYPHEEEVPLCLVVEVTKEDHLPRYAAPDDHKRLLFGIPFFSVTVKLDVAAVSSIKFALNSLGKLP